MCFKILKSFKGNRELIARDFFEKILGLDYDHVILFPVANLWDFPVDESKTELIQKIQDIYGVDISDIKDGNFDKIFGRIEKLVLRHHDFDG